jgi:glycosyltransferase involved in cell wall biosynthesis
MIAFSGNLEYHPNISAVRYFREEIWPELRARWPGLVWRLIGKNPEAVASIVSGDPRIELTGPVEDAVAELARAKVAIVPVLAGSGTRVKIIEAWAAGVPVVSTPLGAEGLSARAGEHLLLANDAVTFRDAVSSLLADGALRNRIGRAGRYQFECEFTWEAAWKCLQFLDPATMVKI